MPYADAGHIALIAPYASQAGGGAAAGAEDHPDAQGGWGQLPTPDGCAWLV